MTERIALLIALFILAGIFSYRHRTTKKSGYFNLPDKFSNSNSLPTILYFWTEQCVQCTTSQKPALNNLKDKNGKFNLVSVNAIKEMELASEFKVKTVPSTIIFSAEGKSRFINNGYINENELEKQIEASLN
ncbi:MAG: thioredoxin family protein [Ignavibacteriaceae bacterium]|nr:thioredoxin family protein [Ignavibacteriaceae bacterium]